VHFTKTLSTRFNFITYVPKPKIHIFKVKLDFNKNSSILKLGLNLGRIRLLSSSKKPV